MSYSVLIVDDEKKIREGLIRHVEWDVLNFLPPLQAAEGIAALEIIRRTPVDVLITDIRMPIMDGLKLAEETTRVSPHTSIVILSGYSDFEYAKQAMSFGVKHYLSKPTDLEQVSKALASIQQDLERRRRQHTQLKTIEKKYLNAVDLIVEQFLLDIMDGGLATPESISEFQLEHRIELPYGSYCLIALKTAPAGTLVFTNKSAVYRDIRKLLERHEIAIIPFSRQREEGIYILVNFDGQDQIVEVAQQLSIGFLDHAGEAAAVLVSGPFASLSELNRGYRQLQTMAHIVSAEEKILIYTNIRPDHQTPEAISYSTEMEKRLLAAITSCNRDKARQEIEEMFAALRSSRTHIETYREFFAKLFFAVEACMQSFHIDLYDIIGERIFPLQKVREQSDPAQIELLLKQLVDRCAASLSENKTPASHKFVDQIKRYIELNFQEEITLHSAAEAVHLSPTYISKIFKKVTGASFIEYLSQFRVRQAQKMLRDVHAKVYEIGENVGYKSTKHFSQVFKAYTGMTPTEYRESIRGGEDA